MRLLYALQPFCICELRTPDKIEEEKKPKEKIENQSF